MFTKVLEDAESLDILVKCTEAPGTTFPDTLRALRAHFAGKFDAFSYQLNVQVILIHHVT